jgi:hypothetical protein
MASILSAKTTSATAMVHTADTSGVLQLASNNGTVALTIDTSQNVGLVRVRQAHMENLIYGSQPQSCCRRQYWQWRSNGCVFNGRQPLHH